MHASLLAAVILFMFVGRYAVYQADLEDADSIEGLGKEEEKRDDGIQSKPFTANCSTDRRHQPKEMTICKNLSTIRNKRAPGAKPKFTFCGLRPSKAKKLPKYDSDFDIFCKWNDDMNSFHCVVPLDKAVFTEVLNNAALALVFFYHSEFKETAKGQHNFYQAALHSQRKHHVFGSINCLEEPEVCCKQGIDTVPFLKLYANKKVIDIKDPTSIEYMGILKWMDSFRI